MTYSVHIRLYVERILVDSTTNVVCSVIYCVILLV